MASLLPLIQDILPMILPSQIHVTRGRDLAPDPPPGSGSPEPRLDLLNVAPVPSDEGIVAPPADSGRAGDGGDAVAQASTNAITPTTARAAAPPAATTTSPGEHPRTVAGRGVVRRDAILNKTDRMCASVLFAGPRSSSAIHHNSEHDSIIYAASGRGILATSPAEDDGPPKRVELEPGDFVFIPSWTEHQLINDSDEQVTWVVIQGGPSPIVVNLKEWGGDEMEPERLKR